MSTNTPQQPVVKQPSKKVDWKEVRKEVREWLNVLGVFLIPLMIGVYTICNNMQQNMIANESHQADIALQTDQQRETVLDSYIQNMKDLLSTEGLQRSKPGDEVRAIAGAQTLITLRQLDGARKGLVIVFLSEAHLITRILKPTDSNDLSIVDLSYGDISGSNLSGADLHGAVLHDANLHGAHLRDTLIAGAILYNSDLSDADLYQANLNQTNLQSTHLEGAHLEGARLKGACLKDADLNGADLNGADLNGANLISADLNGANLTSAIITQQQVNQATTCKGTMTSNGITHSQNICPPTSKVLQGNPC